MGKLKIGWALRDVSTTEPVNLIGQFEKRISKGIADPIYVTALVIDDSEDCVIFLSMDAVVLRCGILDEIRDNIAAMNPQIPVMKVLANATHTHSSPQHTFGDSHDYKGISIEASFDLFPHEGTYIASPDEYRHFLAKQAAEAVCEAWENRCAGGISYGYGFAVVAHSRRVVYFDDLSERAGAVHNSTHGVNGHAAMYGNTNDENFSHYEAGADHFINLLFTHDADGKLTGVIVNLPCPSQNSEMNDHITADYWSDVRRELQKRFGPIHVLPQCAAAGDLSPRLLHYQKAQDRRFRLKYGAAEDLQRDERELCARKDIAARVAEAADEVYSWASKEILYELPVRHRVEEILLTRRRITDEEYKNELAEYAEVLKKPFMEEGTPEEMLFYNSTLAAIRLRHEQIIRRYEEQDSNGKLPMELHTLRIGDVAFASNRFELYMDYQHRIQARSPFEQTFIVQLAGQPGEEGGTYLCTERGAWGRGYSASRYCNVVSPEGGQELVEATLRALREISSE